MLAQRLQRRVDALEKEREGLIDALHRLANESVAKVYLLEEGMDEVRRQRDLAIERLEALDGKLRLTKGRVADLEAKLKAR